MVSRIYDNTPLALTDIKEGDLILKVNNRIVDSIKIFRNLIDTSKPGSEITFTIYRNGKIIDCAVIVGKEIYKIGIFLL